MARDYIYARISRDTLTVENQIEMLKKDFPNAHVVAETGKGNKQRKGLNSLIDTVAPGDRIIVVALDRLYRNTIELLKLLDVLAIKDIVVTSLREGQKDPRKPSDRMYITVLAAVAEMELGMIRERTSIAMDRVKRAGTKVGAKPKFSSELWSKAEELKAAGMGINEIGHKLQIHPSTVSRYFAKKRDI
jgi:DNA invertase Pin-like site-specific DNA recombinase